MKSFKITLFDNSTVIHKGHRLWCDSSAIQILQEKEVVKYGEGKYDTVALYPLDQIKSAVEV